MNRVVRSSELVFDQLSIYDNSGVRIDGISHFDFTLSTFCNNLPQSWVLSSGVGIPNGSISSGSVYFQEIDSNPGYYSLRVYLPKTGFWFFCLRHTSSGQEFVFSYDAGPGPDYCQPGIVASFT